jgi:hypothetical protein
VQWIPKAVNLGFLDTSKYLLNYPYHAETHYDSENLVAPGIEPWTTGSVARNSDRYTTGTVLTYVDSDADIVLTLYVVIKRRNELGSWS